MKLNLCYRYTYQGELNTMHVEYDDGAVTVTHGDKVYNLTHDAINETLTGSGALSSTRRNAIADLLSAAIEQAEATASFNWFG